MLVILASLLIPVSVISVWAIRTVTDTDQYVATMAPLARNQIIVDHLAQKATDELFSTQIVQKKVTAVLPPKAKPTSPPSWLRCTPTCTALRSQCSRAPGSDNSGTR